VNDPRGEKPRKEEVAESGKVNGHMFGLHNLIARAIEFSATLIPIRIGREKLHGCLRDTEDLPAQWVADWLLALEAKQGAVFD
jgi:hypothetical protein